MRYATLQKPLKTVSGNVVPAGTKIEYRVEQRYGRGFARVPGVSGEAEFELRQLNFVLELPNDNLGTLVKLPQAWEPTLFYADNKILWPELFGDHLDVITGMYENLGSTLEKKIAEGGDYAQLAEAPPSSAFSFPAGTILEILGTERSPATLLQNLVFKVISSNEDFAIPQGSTIYAPICLSNVSFTKEIEAPVKSENIVLESETEIQVELKNNVSLWENYFVHNEADAGLELSEYYLARSDFYAKKSRPSYKNPTRTVTLPAGTVIREVSMAIDPETFNTLRNILVVSSATSLSSQMITCTVEVAK